VTAPTAVRTNLVLALIATDSQTLPVPAELWFDRHDPYAVVATFDVGGGRGIRWTFARDLLVDGLAGIAGEGDVAVWPDQAPTGGTPTVVLRLASPDGAALLHAEAADVVAFLAATYQLVPLGDESRHLDVDVAISALLTAGEPTAG
jgi:hypothetical protein